MRTILVTGANGFVGRAVCRVLLAAGHRVRAGVRRPETAPPGTEPVQVTDLGPGADWRHVITGADSVVHLAARVHVMAEKEPDPLAAFRYINTFGTETLAEQAASRGVARFVFMSTVKVHGERTHGRPFSTADAPRPTDPYAISKLEAEGILARIAPETGMKIAAFRPPLVYGPGVKGNFLSLMQAVEAGKMLPVGAIDNRRSLIFVDNLAGAVLAALEEPVPAPFEPFLVKDGEDVSTPELVRRLGSALGRQPRLLAIGETWLRLAGRLTGRSAMIQRLTESLEVDDGPTRERLGWVPTHSLDAGLAVTAAWFREGTGGIV